jgi:hypothetical protein
MGSIDLVHYQAPLWDPFPHTFRVILDTDGPVNVTVRYSGSLISKETISGSMLEQDWIVYPGEIIDARLDYAEGVSGKVKTILWCDSWTYTAYIFVIIGLLILAYSIYKTN